MLKMDLYISVGGQTKMQGWLGSLLQGDKWVIPIQLWFLLESEASVHPG